MPPNRRRPLGPGGAANEPPEPSGNGRQDPDGLSRYERAMFGHLLPQPEQPAEPDWEYVPDAVVHDWTLDDELNDAIERATSRVSPATADALRRAFEGDDSLLLSKRPTHSSNPPRPRTMAAGFDARTKTLFVRFRGRRRPGGWDDGVGYEYRGVTRAEWRQFRDGPSPGKYINDVLNRKDYSRAAW